MKQRVRDLVAQGDALFSRRQPVLGLWQTIADQFYPTRADFTRESCLGEEYGTHLMTGAPVLAHRELKDQFAAMLRPAGKDWFGMTVEREAVAKDSQVKAWFEAQTATMRRIMYDRAAGFTSATKEGDADFAAFGQTVISVRLNQTANGLLHRCWHLRDCAWAEDANRAIDTMHRKWKLPVRGVLKLFPGKADPRLTEKAQKDPNALDSLRHIVLPSDEYDFTYQGRPVNKERFPFISIYVDEEHDTLLEEVPQRRFEYVVPRWQTMSGTPYALSPATIVGLPDARLLQQITLTLLEAGEKAVNPPLIAMGDQIQGGVNVYAGGVTWVDAEYDETTGKALRALDGFGKGNLAFGADMGDRYLQLIQKAFYLDKIQLPPSDRVMTATEVRSRTSDWIRASLPLFEPMETEYNGGLCEAAFNVILDAGGFGNLMDMPQALRGQEIKFEFESPIQQAKERDKSQAMLEELQLIGAAAQIDPQAAVEVDARKMLRDALLGVGPADWLTDDETAQKVRAQMAQEQKLQQAGQQLAQGAGVAGAVGDAASKLQQAGLVPTASPLPQLEGAPA